MISGAPEDLIASLKVLDSGGTWRTVPGLGPSVSPTGEITFSDPGGVTIGILHGGASFATLMPLSSPYHMTFMIEVRQSGGHVEANKIFRWTLNPLPIAGPTVDITSPAYDGVSERFEVSALGFPLLATIGSALDAPETLSVQWWSSIDGTFDTTPADSLGNIALGSAVTSSLTAGEQTIRLRVTDSAGAVSEQIINILIIDPAAEIPPEDSYDATGLILSLVSGLIRNITITLALPSLDDTKTQGWIAELGGLGLPLVTTLCRHKLPAGNSVQFKQALRYPGGGEDGEDSIVETDYFYNIGHELVKFYVHYMVIGEGMTAIEPVIYDADSITSRFADVGPIGGESVTLEEDRPSFMTIEELEDLMDFSGPDMGAEVGSFTETIMDAIGAQRITHNAVNFASEFGVATGLAGSPLPIEMEDLQNLIPDELHNTAEKRTIPGMHVAEYTLSEPLRLNGRQTFGILSSGMETEEVEGMFGDSSMSGLTLILGVKFIFSKKHYNIRHGDEEMPLPPGDVADFDEDGSEIDSDLDGWTDMEELAMGTDPMDSSSHPAVFVEEGTEATWGEGPDSDGDGFSDSWELGAGTDPHDASDHPEVVFVHMELHVWPDSDGDGVSDHIEHALGSDPLDPESVPGAWTAEMVLMDALPATSVGGVIHVVDDTALTTTIDSELILSPTTTHADEVSWLGPHLTSITYSPVYTIHVTPALLTSLTDLTVTSGEVFVPHMSSSELTEAEIDWLPDTGPVVWDKVSVAGVGEVDVAVKAGAGLEDMGSASLVIVSATHDYSKDIIDGVVVMPSSTYVGPASGYPASYLIAPASSVLKKDILAVLLPYSHEHIKYKKVLMEPLIKHLGASKALHKELLLKPGATIPFTPKSPKSSVSTVAKAPSAAALAAGDYYMYAIIDGAVKDVYHSEKSGYHYYELTTLPGEIEASSVAISISSRAVYFSSAANAGTFMPPSDSDGDGTFDVAETTLGTDMLADEGRLIRTSVAKHGDDVIKPNSVVRGEVINGEWVVRGVEQAYVKDSDEDMLPDSVEVGLGMDPNDSDSNDDGILDGHELLLRELLDEEINSLLKELSLILKSSEQFESGPIMSGENIFIKTSDSNALVVEVSSDRTTQVSPKDKKMLNSMIVDLLSNIELE